MRTLLIDGDILAYSSSAATDNELEFASGVIRSASMSEAVAAMHRQIDKLMDELFADKALFALSDPDVNFRNSVLPSYKMSRKGAEKPLYYNACRRYLMDEADAKVVPTLEGDDVLGIMSTSSYWPGEKIIVSIDKDMKTVPGLLYSPNDPEVREITEEQADYWHMFQTLTGDTVDWYHGVPGLGAGQASHLLKHPTLQEVYEHTFKKGPRESLTEMRVRPGEPCDIWSAVVNRFDVAAARGKLGDTERYPNGTSGLVTALEQARCARILRHSDYQGGKVRLWTPLQ